MSRLPIVEHGAIVASMRLTKQQWIELYRDLYRQTYGEYEDDTAPLGWLEDAKRRHKTLRLAGLTR